MTAEPSRLQSRVEPALRVRRHRRAARVLLIDDQDRTLLFQDSDPLLDGTRWWITPGGGIDPGETEIDAAIREVAEETGLIITVGELLGPLARGVAVHGYSDRIVEQTEVFFAVRVSAFEVDVAGHTQDEKLTMTSHHWFTRSDLLATADWIWPEALPEVWALLDQPERWPVDLGVHEQSTVPV